MHNDFGDMTASSTLDHSGVVVCGVFRSSGQYGAQGVWGGFVIEYVHQISRSGEGYRRGSRKLPRRFNQIDYNKRNELRNGGGRDLG